MLDLMTPLGRPPLDTYSPTQVVRTADTMPAGVWELDGSVFTLGGGPIAQGSVRYGLLPGLQVDAGYPAAAVTGVGRPTGRRMLAVSYAPIPALWALSLSYDPPNDVISSWHTIEAGTTFEIGLPWVTPRISPRVSYQETLFGRNGGTTAWDTRVDIGFETPRLFRTFSLGADFDYGTTYSTANLGIRARLFGNVGAAGFAGWQVPAFGSTATGFQAGLVVGLRL